MFKKVDGTLEKPNVDLLEDTKQDTAPVSQKIPLRFFAHRRDRSISYPLITRKADGAEEGQSTEQSRESQLIKFLKEKDSKTYDRIDFGTPVLRQSENKKLEVSESDGRQQSEPQPDNEITQAEYKSPRP